MLKRIILNAGHSISDPGAVYNDTTESMEARKIRDYLATLLKDNFEVLVVPDNLNLEESIKWTNERAKSIDDGLAFSIHLNAGGGQGAETYFYKGYKTSKDIATKMIKKYCAVTGYKNRGAKADSTTRHKRLGWIRDTNCWSTLIEACFVDNIVDVEYLHKNLDKVGQGMYEGICEIYGIEPKTECQTIIDNIKKELDKLSKLK